MINTPKTLQTRQDFDRSIQTATEDVRQKPAVIANLKGLIEGAYQYDFSRVLLAAEMPDGAMPDYFVVEASEDTERHQLIRAENPTAKIFYLGYTIAQVETIINQLEA